MKKGFLLIDALISLFIITIIANIVFYTYKSEVKYLEIKKKVLEEIKWEKEESLAGIGSCIIEDTSQGD